MKKKNVFMILLVAMLIVSMIGMASAAEATASPTQITETSLSGSDGTGSAIHSTKVTLALEQSFTVTLPADFTLTDDEQMGVYTGLATVIADVHLLNTGNQLTISISSDQTDGVGKYWKLVDGSNHELRYVIKDTSDKEDHIDLASNADWLAEDENFISISAPTTQTRYLHFKVADPVTAVTTYTDQLTFTVKVDSI